MRVYKVKPDPNCKACNGSGEIPDWHNGEYEPWFCECVFDNLTSEHPAPDDDDDQWEIELDLSDFDPTRNLPVSVEP